MFPFLQRQSEASLGDPEHQGWMIDFANRLMTETEDVSFAVRLMTEAIATSAADRWGKQHFLKNTGLAEHVPVDPSDVTVEAAFRHDWSDAQLAIPAAFRAGARDRFEKVPGVSVELQAVPASPVTLTTPESKVDSLDDYRVENQARLAAANAAVARHSQSASIMNEQLSQASGF